MTMAELMREVASLPSEQRDELAAYVLHLRLAHDQSWRTEMTRKIDDRNSSHWVNLEDWKKELAQGSDQ